MIEVTRLNGQRVVINSDLIEEMEALPDTIVRLTSGRSLLVRESIGELVNLLADYRRDFGRSNRGDPAAASTLLTESV